MGENGHDTGTPEGKAAVAEEIREAIEAANEVPAVLAMKGISSAISLDNKIARLRFEDNQGKPFDLLFPLPARRMVQAMLVDIENEAKRRQASVAAIPPRFPASFQIGGHDQMRGMTLFLFDDGTPNEVMYAMPDDAAWKLAENVRETILARKTPAERSRLLAGLSTPSAPKLIFPGH